MDQNQTPNRNENNNPPQVILYADEVVLAHTERIPRRQTPYNPISGRTERIERALRDLHIANRWLPAPPRRHHK